MNCYHLKDWLKNDPTYTYRKPKEIEEYINKNENSLAICADICNGLKQYKRKKRAKLRSGDQPKVGTKNISLHFMDGISEDKHPQFI